MTPPMDRREFLAAGGAAFLGLVAAACSGGNGTTAPPNGGKSNTDAKTIKELIAGKQNTVNVISVQPNLAREDDRLALALVPTGTDGGTVYKGGTARAWVATSETAPLQGPIDLEFHGDGFDRGVYIGRASFDTEGQWLVYVEATPEGSEQVQGGSTLVVGNVPAAPGKDPQPVPGDKAISTPTPTLDDARGVDPICTRVNDAGKREPCTMHQISLDQALKNGKPTVLIIGTPAFCESRFCGPIVDQLMIVQKETADRANFVHIEQWADDKDAPATGTLAPAAAAWRLAAEPVVYYIKPDSTIAEWTIGASDAREMRDLTKTTLLS
ncbi:MAG TPA: hypothetical protein VM841_04065 [Actinomycetota bacterium]|nr:hypothetical protein [Actinomycetota bacterium]